MAWPRVCCWVGVDCTRTGNGRNRGTVDCTGRNMGDSNNGGRNIVPSLVKLALGRDVDFEKKGS
jgi:hypothetical protein